MALPEHELDHRAVPFEQLFLPASAIIDPNISQWCGDSSQEDLGFHSECTSS
jgi:hypothetical protein